MNSLKKSNGMKYVALAALAVILGSGLANAQESIRAKGEFNLPFTAQLGRMTLAPGEYSFTMRTGDLGLPWITVRRGTEGVGIVAAYVVHNRHSSKASYLTAVSAAEGHRITSLQLSNPGVELRFDTPTTELLEAAQTARTSRNLPVLVASK